MVPLPMTVALDAAMIGLAALLIAGIAYAALHQRDPRSGAGPARIIGIGSAGVVGWVGISWVLARSGFFASTAATRVPMIAFGIGVPVVVGLWLLSRSTIRRLIEGIPLPWLVGVQFYRVLGVLFVLAYAQHRMPAPFALPAGIGDIAIGLTAPLAAYALVRGGPSARRLAQAWCALGIADLVIAVTLGSLTSPSAFQQLALGMPNVLITRYPFVLIPVFAVPASVLLHVGVLQRLRTAGEAPSPAAAWRPDSRALR